MATIDFSLTIPEMSKTREDGDVVSLVFSYACIISTVMIPIFLFGYRLTSCVGIFLLIVYISRYRKGAEK